MESIFVNGYHKRVESTGSVLCPRIGLPERIPPNYSYPKAGNSFQSIRDYLYSFIDSICNMVPAVQFEKASFLTLGKGGKNLLGQLINRAQYMHLYTILDVSSGNMEAEENIEEVFCRYGVDACTFTSTLSFSRCKEWLDKGHMPIFFDPKLGLDYDSEFRESEICQKNARMALDWITEIAKDCEFACIGCVVKPKGAEQCRQAAGDDIFFLIPWSVTDCRAEQAAGGLLNSRGQLMGAITGLDFTMSWWDEKKNKPYEGRALEAIKTAIEATNTVIAAAIAIQRKFGKLQQKER